MFLTQSKKKKNAIGCGRRRLIKWTKSGLSIVDKTLIQRNIIQLLRKEGNLAICDNIDGSLGHRVKWN